MTGAAYVALDQRAHSQLNDADRGASMAKRTSDILRAEATGRPWAGLFETDENFSKLTFEANGSKAIRWNEDQSLTQDRFVNWYHWLDSAATDNH